MSDGVVILGPLVCFSWLFSTLDRIALPFSFSLGRDHGQAHDGGARRRRMAARMAGIIGAVVDTSTSLKVMARAWRATRAPIMLSLSRKNSASHRVTANRTASSSPR